MSLFFIIIKINSMELDTLFFINRKGNGIVLHMGGTKLLEVRSTKWVCTAQGVGWDGFREPILSYLIFLTQVSPCRHDKG